LYIRLLDARVGGHPRVLALTVLSNEIPLESLTATAIHWPAGCLYGCPVDALVWL